MVMLWLQSRPKSAPKNHAERQANADMLAKFSHHVLHSDSQLFPPTGCLTLGCSGQESTTFSHLLFRMKWMAAAHSILTFPLLFALSLFNGARVQQAVPHLKIVATWCVPQWSVPYLSIIQLSPLSHLCRTTGHGGPHGGHNHALPYHALIMVLYIARMATATIQSASIALALPKVARQRARLRMQAQHTVAPTDFAFQFWKPAMSTCAFPSAHRENKGKKVGGGTTYHSLPYL